MQKKGKLSQTACNETTEDGDCKGAESRLEPKVLTALGWQCKKCNVLQKKKKDL